MLEGAIIGAVVGLILGIGLKLFGKGKPCPQCNKRLPIPWVAGPRQCPQCGCQLNKRGEKISEEG
jgi:ssDNA-binding Zn-finger/Zn-ribbon topoisomerase 1